MLYLSGSILLAQPFDPDRLALGGEPTPVAEGIQLLGGTLPNGVFSASDTGVLAYLTGLPRDSRQLTWLDRTGKAVSTVGDRAADDDVMLSPDARRAAVSVVDPAQRTGDIWLVDLMRGVRTRFTFDPADEVSPVWSPDGDSIVFTSNRTKNRDLYRKASNGAGNEEALLSDSVNKPPTSWSPDGRFILYTAGDDVWVLPLVGDRKPFPFLQTPFIERSPQFSPDGRWIAYASDESGRTETYVAKFPGPGGKWQISTGGGSFPRWSRDGREIFFGGGGGITGVEVNGAGTGFEIGVARPLFEPGAIQVGGARTTYDLAPDGQRWLASVTGEQAPPTITVVVNWQNALR